LSAFSAGCILVQLQAGEANTQEQVQPALASLGPIDNRIAEGIQIPPRNKIIQDPPKQLPPKPKKDTNTRSQSRDAPLQSDWLLRKNFQGRANGVWLIILALLIGGFGACLGIWNWMQTTISNHENIKDIKDLQKRFKTLDIGVKGRTTTNTFDSTVSVLSAQILALENHARRQSKELADLKSQFISHLSDSPPSKDYPLNAPATNIHSSELNLPTSFWTEAPQPASPPQPTPSDLQAALTALINRGDRQSFKKEVRSELNVTDDSASLIATGRITQTELEEVAGGGSYWLVEIAGQIWLYPTDLTLSGFSQFQPSKGIFGYEKQQIPAPQVLTPALLEPLGSNWRIAQLGSIAVPG
jgi:hypothetical protein